MENRGIFDGENLKQTPLPPLTGELETTKRINDTLTRYIDFASLGTVADCMPIIGENRMITTLGLRQMQRSESV